MAWTAYTAQCCSPIVAVGTCLFAKLLFSKGWLLYICLFCGHCLAMGLYATIWPAKITVHTASVLCQMFFTVCTALASDTYSEWCQCMYCRSSEN
jgi:hypothetical protein